MVDRLCPVPVVIAEGGVGIVVPVGGAVLRVGADEGAAPVFAFRVIRIAVEEIEDAGRVAHFDVGLLRHEQRAEVAVVFHVCLGKGRVAQVAALVTTHIHAAETGVALNPPEVRVVLVEVVPGLGVLAGIPGAHIVETQLGLDRRVRVHGLRHIRDRSPYKDVEGARVVRMGALDDPCGTRANGGLGHVARLGRCSPLAHKQTQIGGRGVARITGTQVWVVQGVRIQAAVEVAGAAGARG